MNLKKYILMAIFRVTIYLTEGHIFTFIVQNVQLLFPISFCYCSKCTTLISNILLTGRKYPGYISCSKCTTLIWNILLKGKYLKNILKCTTLISNILLKGIQYSGYISYGTSALCKVHFITYVHLFIYVLCTSILCTFIVQNVQLLFQTSY